MKISVIQWLLTWDTGANYEGISCVALATSTNWTVVDNLTDSILSTSPRAWIGTLLIDTSLVVRTLWTHNTFRTTTRGTTNVGWFAGTNSLTINFTTHTVWTTWRWIARVKWSCFHDWNNENKKSPSLRGNKRWYRIIVFDGRFWIIVPFQRHYLVPFF